MSYQSQQTPRGQLLFDPSRIEQLFIDAYAEANNPSRTFAEQQHIKKIEQLQIELNYLKPKYQALEAKSQYEKIRFEAKIKTLQNKIKSLESKNQTTTDQKEKKEDEINKLKVEQQKKDRQLVQKNKQLQQKDQQLKQKDEQIKQIQNNLNRYEISMKSLAQNFIDALNVSRQKKFRPLKQNDDTTQAFKFCIQQVRKYGTYILDLSSTLSNCSHFLELSQKAVQVVQITKYSPANLIQRQPGEIFKQLRLEIEKKVTEELKIKKDQKSLFNDLTQFLFLTDTFIAVVLAEWSKELTSAKTTINSLTIQNQELKQQNDRLRSQIKKLEDKLKLLQAQKIGLSEELKRQKEQAQKKIGELETDIKKLKTQIESKDQLISNLKTDISQKQTQIKTKITKIQQLDSQVNKLTQNLKTVQGDLNKLIQQKKKIQQQSQFRSSIIVTKQGELDQLTKQNNEMTQQINQLQDQIKNTKRDLQQAESKIDTYLCNLNEKERKQQELRSRVSDAQQCIKHLQLQRKSLQTQYTHILNNPPRQYLQYFNGHILNINNRQYVKWLVQNFQKISHKTIRSTKPLYRSDTNNKTPFHTYIDNHQNISLIVQMNTGQIIFAYSAPAFVPKTNVEFKEGYILGLRNKKIFRTKSESTNNLNRTNPKPITYDEFFLIWGNSDLRIKPASKELYSNYGTPSSSYQESGNPNSTIVDLFEQEERDAFFVNYEFFQIEFEKQ